MNINPNNNRSVESQAKIHLDKLLNSSSISSQALVAYALFQMIAGLTTVFALLNSARNSSNLAAIKAGFNSADETAAAGRLVGIGGLVLGAAGVVQGIGKFQEAKGIAEATQIRNRDLKMLDEESKAKDLKQGLTVEVEAVDQPCTSSINEGIVLEVEEEALRDAEGVLSAKQTKMQDKAEDLKQESIAKEDRVYGDVKKNKRIKLINKDYEVRTDRVKAGAGKLQAIGNPGQAAYYVAQGLSEHQKAKSQKEGLIQQVQQDNQNQQGNTADGVKREIDKLSDFDPFQRNSASQR